MLTNNKKSIFAKSIAMVMAVLMVLAVCLTGCADKTAQEAANNAQTTATEAKTAADAVKKALEDHLASLDPVTLEMVNQEIKKALVDYATTEALEDFVKKGELTDLSNKLADCIKKAELEAAVKALVLPYVKPADLTTEVNKLTELINAKATKEDITKALNEALADNATDAELAAKATELTNAINAVDKKVNDLDIKGEINKALVNYATKEYVDAAVNAGKYNDSALTARVEKLEAVVEAILEAFYTEKELEERADNIDLIDMTPAEITKHINDTWSINAWNAATVEVLALIEDVQDLLNTIYDPVEGVYTKANMDKINAELAKVDLDPIFVNGVRTDKDAYVKMLTYTLLRLPNKKTLTAYQNAFAEANKVPNFKTEYAALLDTLFAIGHKETVSGKTYQVVTTVEKAQIEAFNAAYDAKITEYVAENAFAGNTKYSSTFGALTAINVFENAGEKVAAAADTYKTGTAPNEVTWTKVGKTIRPAGAFKTTDKLPSTVAFDYVNAATDKVVVTGKYGDAKQTVAAKADDEAAVYTALYTQMDECFAAIKAANDIFAKFCEETVDGNTVADLPDLAKTEAVYKAYVDALESYMCIEIEGYDVDLYLVTDVKPVIDAAIARNNCGEATHTATVANDTMDADLIVHYDLYRQMRAKVDEVLFYLYKSYAMEMLANIKFDYMSVSWYLSTNTPTPDVKANSITVAGSYIDTEVTQGIADGTLSAGFIDAFLNGTETTFKGWVSTGEVMTIAKSFKNTALVNYYGALNGTAKDAAGKAIAADPVATIVKFSAENNTVNIRQYLNSAIYKITLDLNAAEYVEGRDETFFVDLLNKAVANLDEVYNRYLTTDYTKVQINTIYAKAVVLADLYCADDHTDVAAAIEQYLTGYSVTTGVAATGANAIEASLTNAALTTELAKAEYNFDVTNKALHDIDGKTQKIAMLGGPAMTAAKAAAESFLANMEEIAIKDNFIVYLDTALTNLTNVFYNYFAITGLDYKTMTELNAMKNNFDATISMVKFMADAGQIVFGTYRENYAQLLAIVATEEQDAHIKQLQTWEFEGIELKVYVEAKKAVKSSATDKTFVTDGLNKVNMPVDWTNAAKPESWVYVGGAAVAFDEIVNANACYMDGTVAKPLY